MMSEEIEQFLKFLRESEQYLHIGQANEQEANDATQDILHALELEDMDYHRRAHLAIKLGEVRAARRAAKDLVAAATPIVNWLESNRAVVKSLEKLLGELRKVEKNAGNRIYTPRTDVLEEAK